MLSIRRQLAGCARRCGGDSSSHGRLFHTTTPAAKFIGTQVRDSSFICIVA